jgi:hypothetical protein
LHGLRPESVIASVRDSRARFGESGFSLMEAIVATVISVIAALGLAYSFGIGRGNVTRFEAARMADARAMGRMEQLSMLMRHDPGAGELQAGVHPDTLLPFEFHGSVLGHEYWRVDSTPAAAPASIRSRMALLTVEVAWVQAGVADTARYTRLFGRGS